MIKPKDMISPRSFASKFTGAYRPKSAVAAPVKKVLMVLIDETKEPKTYACRANKMEFRVERESQIKIERMNNWM